MIVRELVTLLRYQEDKAGMNSYAAGLRRLAALAASLFSVKTIMDTADAWTTVRARVGLVTNSVAEQEEALASLFEISQRTGQSYVDTANLFTTVGRNAKELNLTLQQQLDLSETVNKAIAIGGGSKAATQAALVQLGQALGAGTLQGQELNSILEQAPRLAKAIADGLGVPVGQLKVLGEGRKLTSKNVAEVLLKQLPVLEAEFAKMPITFTRAFQVVENRFGKFIDDIGKATDLWQIMAKGIITTSEYIFDKIELLRDIVAGYGNALRLASIAFVALVGPTALRLVARMVTAMRALTLASIGIALPWYLLVGLIALVGLALEDLYAWFQGKDTITEELIGPYSEWKGTIDEWKDTVIAALKVIAVAVGAYLTANLITALLTALGGLGTSLSTVGVAARGAAAGLATTEAALISTNTAALGLLGTVGKLLLGLVGVAALAWAVHPTSTQTQDQENKLMGREPGTGPMGEPPSSVPSGETRAGQRLRSLLEFVTPKVTAPDAPTTGPTDEPKILRAPRLPGEPDARMPSLSPLFLPTPNPANYVPPSAMAPPNVTNTTNNDVRAPISVTVNSASDTPQAVGAAAGEGARRGALEGWARTLGVAAPQTEFGLAY